MRDWRVWLLKNEPDGEEIAYLRKPTVEDLLLDILGEDDHHLEDIKKMEELVEDGVVIFNNKRYKVEKIRYVQN